jgi:transcriptional regulator with XRE-family HTH domain
MAIRRTLADRLAQARKVAEITRRELAHLANVAPTYPGQIELGQKENVGSRVLSELARVMGLSLDWLVDGKGSIPGACDIQEAIEKAKRRAKRRDAKARRS